MTPAPDSSQVNSFWTESQQNATSSPSLFLRPICQGRIVIFTANFAVNFASVSPRLNTKLTVGNEIFFTSITVAGINSMHHYAWAKKSVSDLPLGTHTVLLLAGGFALSANHPHLPHPGCWGTHGACSPPLMEPRLRFLIYPTRPRAPGTAFWNRCMPSVSYRSHLYLSIPFGWRQ